MAQQYHTYGMDQFAKYTRVLIVTKKFGSFGSTWMKI
jgi:hypothetical protein